MHIGAMNHPGEDPIQEIEWISSMGFEFIDFTLEPPRAASWQIHPQRIRSVLAEARLGIVGHTAYYLPIASPFEEVRCSAVSELRRCLRIFSEIGAQWMNIHPDRGAPLHARSFVISRNLQSIEELLGEAESLGIGLMVENLPGSFNSVKQLGEILGPLPSLGFHLDIGHANLQTDYNTTEELLGAFGSRLRHTHLHDNKGGSADLHLPLGAGTLDIPHAVGALKASGFDGTITLEVFSHDRSYLAHSRALLRKMWDGAAESERTVFV